MKLIQYFQDITESKAHWVSDTAYRWHPRRVLNSEDLALFIELYHHTVQLDELDEAYRVLQGPLDILVNRIGMKQTAIKLLRVFFTKGEDKPPQLEFEAWRDDVQAHLVTAYIQSGQPHRALLIKAIANYENEEFARVFISVGALHDAQDYLQKQIESLRNISPPVFLGQDRTEKAALHYELGNLYSYCDNWSKAEQEFYNQLETQEQIKNLRKASFLWGIRAHHVLRMIRDHKCLTTENRRSAIIYAQHSLDIAENERLFPVEPNLIFSHWLLGAGYLGISDLQQAEYHLSDALTRDRAVSLVEIEANILLDLARLRYDQKKYEEAKSLADEALLITERCGYVLQGADVNLFLAQYALEQEKDNVKAKAHAEEALKLATCDGPPYYYKVAYEEAERFLENLGSPVINGKR